MIQDVSKGVCVWGGGRITRLFNTGILAYSIWSSGVGIIYPHGSEVDGFIAVAEILVVSLHGGGKVGGEHHPLRQAAQVVLRTEPAGRYSLQTHGPQSMY